VDTDDHIADAENVECANDADAYAKALQMQGAYPAVEVWEGARRVARMGLVRARGAQKNPPLIAGRHFLPKLDTFRGGGNSLSQTCPQHPVLHRGMGIAPAALLTYFLQCSNAVPSCGVCFLGRFLPKLGGSHGPPFSCVMPPGPCWSSRSRK
jgi:hypothetical protein